MTEPRAEPSSNLILREADKLIKRNKKGEILLEQAWTMAAASSFMFLPLDVSLDLLTQSRLMSAWTSRAQQMGL